MSQIRHTDVLDTSTRWLGRLTQQLEQGPMDPAVLARTLTSIQEALLTARADLKRREMAMVVVESRISDAVASDRIDTLYAVRIAKSAMHALERQALFCVGHATKEERRRIDQDTQTIIDALEGLTMGIERPLPKTTSTPDIGA